MEREDACHDSGTSPPEYCAPAETVWLPSAHAIAFWDEVDRLYALLQSRRKENTQCPKLSPPSTRASQPKAR